MVQQLLAWALGPSGMKILDWYVANSLAVNTVVVAAAILALVFPRHNKRVQAFLGALWAKTPFALSPQDRKAVDAVRARYEARKRSGKAK
ncbi:MAG TPA: hypothetical protein VLD63_01220 [Anaerolineales bacterium]|nr:hypothetical protein [Anaerolineales bacterium]